MAEFVKVSSKSEVPLGEGRMFEVNGKEIALFNVKGSFYAIDNACAHVGGPLAEGYLEDDIVTCPLHAWQYNVITGQCAANPSVAQQKYKVKIEGNDILIAV